MSQPVIFTRSATSSRRTLPVTGAVIAAVLLCGCSGSKPAAAPPPSSAAATQTPSPSDSAAPDKAAVLDAYAHFWAEQVKSYAQGTSDGTDLEKYAIDPALGKVRISMYNNRNAGIVFKGAPKNSATVTAIDTSKSPKEATLSDCLDISGWTPVDAKTGATKPVTNPQLRYVVSVSARTVGADWKISEFTSDKSRPC